MHTVSFAKIPELLREIVIKHRQPLMMWGPPGTAKSASIKVFCEENSYVLCDIRLGHHESVDLHGFPTTENGWMSWSPPATLPFVGNDLFPDDVPIILFLDEINSASQAVFAVAMQLVHERCVGEHALKENVYVVAAGNREGDKGVANRMPTPLANRFTHVEIENDVNAYCFYRQAKGCMPEEVAFYQWRKDLLNTFDPKNSDKAFATMRSSEVAWTYLLDQTMSDDIKKISVAGAVGSGVGAEIYGFLDVWKNIVPLKDILADPEHAPISSEPSMQYAMTVSLAGAMDVRTAPKIGIYMMRMPPEFGVLMWQLATRRDKALYQTQTFITWSKKYGSLFTR